MKAVFEPVGDSKRSYDRLLFWCPGCNEHHVVNVNHPDGWGWNGSLERPTITPSIRVSRKGETLCHSFVTDGRIQFLGDCAHKLAGQTVELLEIED